MFEVTRKNADTNIRKYSAIRIVFLLITLSLLTVIAKSLKTKGNNGPFSSKLLLGNVVATQYNCQAAYILFANFTVCLSIAKFCSPHSKDMK